MTRMIRGKVIVEKKAEGASKEVGVPALPEEASALPQNSEFGEERNPLRDGDTFAPPSAPWVGAEKAWRTGIVPPPHEEWSRYEKRIAEKRSFLKQDLTLTDVEVATVLSTLPPPATAHAEKEPSQLFKYAAMAALTAVTAWAVISASRAAHHNSTTSPNTVTPAAAFESAAMLPERDNPPAPEIEETVTGSSLPAASNAVDSAAAKATPRSKIAASNSSAAKRASVPSGSTESTANPYSEIAEPTSLLSSEGAVPEAAAATTRAHEETFSLSNPYGTAGGIEVSSRVEATTAAADSERSFHSLTRETVRSVMNGIAPEVIKCGNGREEGKIVLRVTVSGATGRVQDAEAAYAPYVNTPVGFCAARAVRFAKFPQFSESEITIKYPFEF